MIILNDLEARNIFICLNDMVDGIRNNQILPYKLRYRFDKISTSLLPTYNQTEKIKDDLINEKYGSEIQNGEVYVMYNTERTLGVTDSRSKDFFDELGGILKENKVEYSIDAVPIELMENVLMSRMQEDSMKLLIKE